jgi:hypothetical protein
MKTKMLLCVILVGCTLDLQEKADVRDITGCLSKGDSANESCSQEMMEVPGNCGATEWLSPSTWVIR